MLHWFIYSLGWNKPLKLPACAKSRGAHSVGVCETRHMTMRLRQRKFFAPTHRVTRPPTKGSELPSRRPDLPPSICQNTGAGGGGERKVTPARRNKTASRSFFFLTVTSVLLEENPNLGWGLSASFAANYKQQFFFWDGWIIRLSLKIKLATFVPLLFSLLNCKVK